MSSVKSHSAEKLHCCDGIEKTLDPSRDESTMSVYYIRWSSEGNTVAGAAGSLSLLCDECTAECGERAAIGNEKSS